jgi:hypothetical protein
MSFPLTVRLRKLLTVLESDIRTRVAEDAVVRAPLEVDYQADRKSGVTQQDFANWVEGRITQSGVAWILATVFVRFLEDNQLITPARLLEPIANATGSPIERWQLFTAKTPTANRRDWMQSEFSELAKLPALNELLGQSNSHLWTLAPSQDGIMKMLDAFSERNDDAKELKWLFRDPELSTRILGDLYQDLSESARKRYALLQTPDFVERFILDRTLEPALDTFSVQYKDNMGGFRLIDPTVGSGHFLLGAFPRILKRWQSAEPGTDIRVLVQRTLDSLHGVDLNPFAVSIARFRMIIVSLKACRINSLSTAPDFGIPLAIGDSLLLVAQRATHVTGQVQLSFDPDDTVTAQLLDMRYDAARKILAKGFHAVVGNPPYIQPPEDLNKAYRQLYGSCSGKYALTCPFMERFVELALPAQGARPAGFVGKITSNSFMKREFGKKLITQFFAKWDLTAAIDTSGAYIPGHGTPTVILFLRNQKPSKSTVRAVLGIRGEPSTPDDPSQGLVWRSILDQIEKPGGSQSNFVSVEDRDRQAFATHPWSLSGGGAGDVKAAIERWTTPLNFVAESIGITCFTLEDDIYLLDRTTASRIGLRVRPMLEGDRIRDWSQDASSVAAFPYDDNLEPFEPGADMRLLRYLWIGKTTVSNNQMFGGRSKVESGLKWTEYGRFTTSKLRTPLSIAFAFVATHNHFVLDRGGKVFNRSAPVIKLKPGATVDEHLALLGILNSSTVGFWGRQIMFNKGGGGSATKMAADAWENFFEWSGMNVGKCPLPCELNDARLISRAMDALGSEAVHGCESLKVGAIQAQDVYAQAATTRLARMIGLQEELDWLVYRLYKLRDDSTLEWSSLDTLPPVNLGERAFEIVMARKIEAGELQTTWFERHGSTPITEVPSHWPAAYRALVEVRIHAIESDASIDMIEQPEFKRRWNHEDWKDTWRNALTERFLDKVEALAVWRGDEPTPKSVAQLADLLARDPEAVELAEHLTGTEAPEMAPFLAELLKDEHVPCAAGARYTESGLRKRQSWEATWDMQRKEDAIDALIGTAGFDAHAAKMRKSREVGDIPVPPKYDVKDFSKASYWQARGKLDVPKERFISYPLAAGDKPTDLVLGWAGWDYFQQAQALVALIHRQQEAGATERMLPLLQGLKELIPWLSQWFGNHVEFGDLGLFFHGTWLENISQAATTTEAVSGWVLQKSMGKPVKKVKVKSREGDDEE